MVKVYLSRAGVPFTESNVSIDPAGEAELRALGRSTTPVTVIGDRVIVGYKPADLAAAVAALKG
jgi:glutaredoxin